MPDERQFVEAMIGLTPPWQIARVVVSDTLARLDVHVGYVTGLSWPCPECRTALPCHDLAAERVWRHLDWFGRQTFVRACVPRVACPTHEIRAVSVPWADPGSRYTTAMERHIADVTESVGVTGAAHVLHIGWEDALHLQLTRRIGA
jgi:transposase